MSKVIGLSLNFGLWVDFLLNRGSTLKTRTLLFLLLFSGSLSAFAQDKVLEQQLRWYPAIKEMTDVEGVKMFYLGFQGAYYNPDRYTMPYFNTDFSLPAQVTGLRAEVDNLTYSALTAEEAKLVDPALIESSLRVHTAVSWERLRPVGGLSFLPFVKNPATGEISKVNSFRIRLYYERNAASANTRSGSRSFASSSVLSSGDWYKIGVTQTGVFRINHAFLRQLGINTDDLPSAAINIYGNSVGMLPELNSVYRPDDLLKNAIYVADGGDGKFDPEDYILFYARNSHNWSYNTPGGYYEHRRNMYSDTSYYFINIETTAPAPKRIASQTPVTASPSHTVTTFDDYVTFENDDVNLLKSGREWFGDLYDYIVERSYTLSFPNIVPTEPIKLKAEFAANMPGYDSSAFRLTIEGTGVSARCAIVGVGVGVHVPVANVAGRVITFTSSSPELKINLTYDKPTASARGWLNYFHATARRNLQLVGNFMPFRDHASVGPGNIADFYLNASVAPWVWEVTSPSEVRSLTLNNLSPNSYNFRVATDSLREFVAFNPATVLPSPVAFGRVANQDLHALGYADMLIVAHPTFLQEANDLALFHQEEGLSVHVVTVDQVYNEFSSGMRDATAIKQFARMFYKRAGSDPNLVPRYLLLFGGGSYDNKNRIGGTGALIPTYQSVNSTSTTGGSFVSDDYFVMLDDHENMNNTDRLDMAIGRLPVRSKKEARDVVQKIKAYSVNTGNVDPNAQNCCEGGEGAGSMGDWRNIYFFVADDEDGSDFVRAAEEFADSLRNWSPALNIDKAYLDAYLQQSTPGGQRYPQATEDIKRRVSQGALVVNYIGHGGGRGWAHERILDVTTINGWNNSPNLPLFMTATCEFARFDDPTATSAGEFVLLNPNGAGIALFTTTRLVYMGPNEVLNRNFNRLVMEHINGRPRTLGEIFMLTKNVTISGNPSITVNTRNFTLLGDPAVRLKSPVHNVVTDSINGVHISMATDTLKALSQVTIKGHIEDYTGQRLTSFNGLVFPTVYDKEQSLSTMGNDPSSPIMSFKLRKNVIYKGKATVTNGEFAFSFIVPKDIAYQFGSGKLSYYAHNGSEDANGYEYRATVGGTNPNAPVDETGPQISLYLNDDKFVPGGITDESPRLYARVSDESGINTVGTGIGHDITAVLNDNTNNTLILNDYYESDANTYKSGRVSYPFNDLPEGAHKLRFKVWDVYNNSGEAETDFVVAKSAELALEHVLNYPNPFSTRTQFFFEHNQVCHSLKVQIQVFTVSGKIVKNIHQIVRTQGFRVEPIEWDGRDDFGDRLATGVYVYRVKVQTDEGKTLEKFEKLVILN